MFVKGLRVAGFIAILFLLIPQGAYSAMTDYCIIPPYVKRDVPPNIMILMDNSNDMFNEAFGDGLPAYNAATDVYNPAKSYIGYFKPDKMYKYKWTTFVECTGGADCIFSGNLMNWATMSRFDILQKVLIGGHTASRQANAHTLSSISGEWTKIWGNCKFSVSSANLTISDSGGTCDLSGGAETTCPNPTDNPDQFPQSTGDGHRRNNPSIITPSSNKLPDAEIDKCYSFTFEAKWGTPEGTRSYTWDITIGSLPAGLSLHADSGKIYGKPTATGTSTFTIRVRNKNNLLQSDSKAITLEVKTGTGTRFRQYNVKVDLPEEPLNDLNGNDIWDPGETFTDLNGNGQWDGKKGVVQEFWDEVNPRARWGMTDFFKNDARVDIEVCIPASPASRFYTAIQNATPAPLSPLAKGVYGATHYFIASTDGRPEYQSNAYHGCVDKDPIDDTPCRLNFILTITSGSDVSGPQLPTGTTSCAESINGDCLKANTKWAYKEDLRNDRNGRQYISTYIVHTFGTTNVDTLRDAASEGGGKFYSADVDNLEQQLRQALQDIIKRAAAGTAASVLASGEGSGANIIQAVFYPRTPTLLKGGIFSEEIDWIGRLSNYWYYVDPFYATSTILDDSGTDPSDRILNLSNDKVIKLRFDTTLETTKADRYSFGSDTLINTIPFENVISLWEAGRLLWERTSARTIKTTIGGGLIDFSTDNASKLRPYLQAADVTEAKNIIRYVHGEDISGYRSRTVAVDLNGNGLTTDAGESAKVWKLGDVLNSTPRISSWIPLNTYHRIYKDTTYGNTDKDPNISDPADNSRFITSDVYRNRGMVFAGGNDGMLHAFKLGRLELYSSDDRPLVARLINPDPSTPLGYEVWSFIPKNVLPYLKYLADPAYCHIYSVDLSPYIFDASIGGSAEDTRTVGSWRTILIGGMRFGGACRNPDSSCTDCVKTPIDGVGYSSYFALDITDQNNPTLLWEFSNENLGFTTTGPAVVRISARDGDGNPDRRKNGHWYVVFGSGPTGPIDTTVNQFLGRSDQNLRLFILDLPTGNLLRIIDTGISNAFAGSMLNVTHDSDLDYQDDVIYIPYVRKDTATNTNTWTKGGIIRLITSEYPDPSEWKWSRVIDGIGPVTSSVTKLQKNKGCYTSNGEGCLWLFFGTGRYYFERTSEVDDPGTTNCPLGSESGCRRLYGVKEPCFTTGGGFDPDCTYNASVTTDVTNIAHVPDEGTANSAVFNGWSIDLDAPGDFTYCEGGNGRCNPPYDDGTGTYVTRAYRGERVITDPLSISSGLVFFTTYKPYSDECSIGGKSFIWAVKYSTGGAPGALLKGKALVQVSTGSIEEVDLSTAFSEKGGRRTSAMEGVPPTSQGLSLMSTPPPVKRVIHIRER